MKKIIAIALIAIVSLTAAFATDTDRKVSVHGNVAEVPATLKLTYNGTQITADTDIYQNSQDQTKWNLQLGGETQAFELKFQDCNYNTDKTYTCDVSATPFRGTVNGSVVDANAVTVNTDSEALTVVAGPHSNVTLKKFHLSWNGDKSVAAGDYVSDVTITYGIN